MDLEELVVWLRTSEAEDFLRDHIQGLDYIWDGEEEYAINVQDFGAGARALADMIEARNVPAPQPRPTWPPEHL